MITYHFLYLKQPSIFSFQDFAMELKEDTEKKLMRTIEEVVSRVLQIEYWFIFSKISIKQIPYGIQLPS